MGVNKSLKIAVITAMTFLLAVLTSTPGNAGLWEWITGEQDSLIPIYDPAASPDAEKVEPAAARRASAIAPPEGNLKGEVEHAFERQNKK